MAVRRRCRGRLAGCVELRPERGAQVRQRAAEVDEYLDAVFSATDTKWKAAAVQGLGQWIRSIGGNVILWRQVIV